MSNSGPGHSNPSNKSVDQLREEQEQAVLKATNKLIELDCNETEAEELVNAVVDATRKLAEEELY